ncbi:MAG: hypothetical protein ACK415_10435 [Thermodesulfovibrionales bacterium]
MGYREKYYGLVKKIRQYAEDYSHEEVEKGSPLFLDMTERIKILIDRDDFFQNYLNRLRIKMSELGARRVFFKGGYYWELKPDYRYGDVIEL